ncbi:hypothetical protein ABT104_01995 [Streptomyces mobaraensis]|uniref:hypothetical protein n=1 Tax=Streptomyces mobaraensis TaxID=35621 RepID=UPI003316F274
MRVKRLDVVGPGAVAVCLDGMVAEHGHLDALGDNSRAGRVSSVATSSAPSRPGRCRGPPR